MKDKIIAAAINQKIATSESEIVFSKWFQGQTAFYAIFAVGTKTYEAVAPKDTGEPVFYELKS